jgi:hypothetical protein
VAVALGVGLVCGLPHLLVPRQLSDPSAYTPRVISDVSFVTVDETSFYAARIREAMDGRWRVTDPLAWESRASSCPPASRRIGSSTHGCFARRQPELLEQWTAWYLFQWVPIAAPAWLDRVYDKDGVTIARVRPAPQKCVRPRDALLRFARPRGS